MSFGGLSYPAECLALRQAIEDLSNNEIICVMSAGNDGKKLSFPIIGKGHFPGSFKFDNTITVGSINNNSKKSGFSNYGNQIVDIAAPGENIYSTIRNSQYGNKSGTSMSTPYVAGAAALLCAAYPTESANYIKALLLEGANKNNGVSDKHWAHGTLDVWTSYQISAPIIITTTSLPSGFTGSPIMKNSVQA